MPVITRNKINNKNIEITREIYKINISKLISDCNVKGEDNKIINTTNLYKYFNKNLTEMVKNDKEYWRQLLVSILEKTLEFDKEFESDMWNNLNKNLIKNFVEEYNKTKKIAIKLIKSDPSINIDYIFNRYKMDQPIKSVRPRRNIKPVDYTGMDSIEPECEDDGITNIWTDLTIYEDPDYEFEDEDEEEDEEEDEDEDENQEDNQEEYVEEYEDDDDNKPSSWAKIHPSIDEENKNNSNKNTNELSKSRRSTRIKQAVDYSGMDMTDELGDINICKRWFEKDGSIKYFWRKYPLSQANEIGDEDYVYEE